MSRQKRQKKINEMELGLIVNNLLTSTYEVFLTYYPDTALTREEYDKVVLDHVKSKQNL